MTPERDQNRRSSLDPKTIVTMGLAVGSLVLSIVAFVSSESTADRQQEFQREIEERQSAPRLAPGVELSQRGREITVFPDSGGKIDKRAERLLIEREAPHRMVLPIRNMGLGVAILLQREFPTPVERCPEQRGARLTGDLQALGYYNIAPGESEQLVFLPQNHRVAPYRAASRALTLNLLLKYTDALQRRLRWTCIRYTRVRRTGSWSVSEPRYGEALGPAVRPYPTGDSAVG